MTTMFHTEAPNPFQITVLATGHTYVMINRNYYAFGSVAEAVDFFETGQLTNHPGYQHERMRKAVLEILDAADD